MAMAENQGMEPQNWDQIHENLGLAIESLNRLDWTFPGSRKKGHKLISVGLWNVLCWTFMENR